jgi:hypothetical protein
MNADMPAHGLAKRFPLTGQSADGSATLQNAVTATDQQIDALVYELYGLTRDEIKTV